MLLRLLNGKIFQKCPSIWITLWTSSKRLKPRHFYKILLNVWVIFINHYDSFNFSCDLYLYLCFRKINSFFLVNCLILRRCLCFPSSHHQLDNIISNSYISLIVDALNSLIEGLETALNFVKWFLTQWRSSFLIY
jgi:hypothetical protein